MTDTKKRKEKWVLQEAFSHTRLGLAKKKKKKKRMSITQWKRRVEYVTAATIQKKGNQKLVLLEASLHTRFSFGFNAYGATYE